ncbi:MAG: hypothetical protein M5U01_22720 [Ardenticatenaceae bacterium]|nr:hypothetical protein [Ardenticatenaceae bacterium]HBY93016.1 hypothetical protein [Chloroflexota bacterium]
MFEPQRAPLLPRTAFLLRQARFGAAALAIIAGSLAIGIWGYHAFEGLPWLDALLNAAMILGGMGPVDPVRTTAGKLFASCYALFSGIIFLVAVGVLVAPLVHRFLHRFHLEVDSIDQNGERTRNQ